jgi:uncharacterized protein
MSNPAPVIHFEIAGSDPKRSREFYSKLFGWTYQMFEGMDYGMVAPSGPNAIGGGIGSAPPGGKPYVTFYVGSDDLQKSCDLAVSLGGTVIVPPSPIPGVGSMAMIADLDGNVVGMFKGNQ